MKSLVGHGSPPPDRYNLTVNNTAGEDAPAYGVAKVVDATAPNDDGNYDIDKPDGEDGTYWLLSPVGAKDGKPGAATNRYPSLAAYDEDDGTPAAGEEWGPKNDSWLLSIDGTGFRILGGAADGLVRVEKVGGGAAADTTRKRARVTTAIPAATDNLIANWGTGGAVRLMNEDTGVLDADPIDVINPLQNPSGGFGIDYYVEVDSHDPPHVWNGSCGVWTWAADA